MSRRQMCEDISSRISSLQVENDEARLLNVGVRPSSSLQQAPWWIKIPKRFTWLNLPDGVTDDQKDKDLARMEFLSILSFLIQLEFVRQVRIFLIVNERKDIPISRRENEREEDLIYLQNTMILKIVILIYQ